VKHSWLLRRGTYRSDYVLKADSVAPPAKLPVYPADLNQGGDLRRHLSNPEQSLKKNGLLRSPACNQTEPAIRDVFHLSTKNPRLFWGLKRRQLASLKISTDEITTIPSFCLRLHGYHAPQGLATISDVGSASTDYEP